MSCCYHPQIAVELITELSLAQNEGPYESWPLTSELLIDGRATGARVPGYVLEAQYRFRDRYLLATSWDCPFEEAQTFVLLSPELRVLGQRTYGAAYQSVWLLGHEPIAADTVRFRIDNDVDVYVTVRERRAFLIGPLMTLRFVRRAPSQGGERA